MSSFCHHHLNPATGCLLPLHAENSDATKGQLADLHRLQQQLQDAENKNRDLQMKKEEAESKTSQLEVKHQQLLVQCDKLMHLVTLTGTLEDTDSESEFSTVIPSEVNATHTAGGGTAQLDTARVVSVLEETAHANPELCSPGSAHAHQNQHLSHKRDDDRVATAPADVAVVTSVAPAAGADSSGVVQSKAA